MPLAVLKGPLHPGLLGAGTLNPNLNSSQGAGHSRIRIARYQHQIRALLHAELLIGHHDPASLLCGAAAADTRMKIWVQKSLIIEKGIRHPLGERATSAPQRSKTTEDTLGIGAVRLSDPTPSISGPSLPVLRRGSGSKAPGAGRLHGIPGQVPYPGRDRGRIVGIVGEGAGRGKGGRRSAVGDGAADGSAAGL